jgi:hypothetical protein
MSAKPHVLGATKDHYWLLQRMAKATGVDLVAAMQHDSLNTQAWAQLVTDCRKCQWTEGCKRFLDRADPDIDSPLPEGCENRAPLEQIRSRLKDTPA